MIKVESLSKEYVLRHQTASNYTALRDVITERAKNLLRSGPKETKEKFLALNDISFEIKTGDRVGIVGRNGAGKSTLLKVLSRIVTPTKGRITIDGRVASLLEVGTGFHPELSGRENIFLNGAILGMSKQEIKAKFDEIVAFSEVERFLDTPVKRYSSGMYVRLAFAVAAHLDPEVLIVDEVLAVGDAQFQKKCLGKMEDVSKSGRTILFVSHNMEAVQRLCNHGLLLERGRLVHSGSMEETIKEYLENRTNDVMRFDLSRHKCEMQGYAKAHQLRVLNGKHQDVTELIIGEPYIIEIELEIMQPIEKFVAAIGISTLLGQPIRTTWSYPNDIRPGKYIARFNSDDIVLTGGQYKLTVGLSSQGRNFQYIDEAGELVISEVSAFADNPQIINTKSGLLINQFPVEIVPM
ncbi:MAG TPA: ABC transporter ATP-binding protein [Flavobacteriales bacterium]